MTTLGRNAPTPQRLEAAQDLREKMTLAVWRKSDFNQQLAEEFDANICLALDLDDDAGFPPFLFEAQAMRG